MSPIKHKNIARIDSDKSATHAWVVVIQRRGIAIVQHFADGRHGGKEKALAAAIIYRDQVLAAIAEDKHLAWVRNRLRKNNTSGIPGVARYETLVNKKTGNKTAFWVACWTNEEGRARRRKFSVLAHGEEGAKQKAIKVREQELQKVCRNKAVQEPTAARIARAQAALTKTLRYPIIIEETDGGYQASAPDWLECVGQGESIEAAQNTLRTAIEQQIATLVADGLPVPKTTRTIKHLDVTKAPPPL